MEAISDTVLQDTTLQELGGIAVIEFLIQLYCSRNRRFSVLNDRDQD